jgi:peroxiredoxin
MRIGLSSSTTSWRFLAASLAWLFLSYSAFGAATNFSSKLGIQFRDASNRGVPGVTVGRVLETSDWKTPPGQPSVPRWRVALSGFETVTTDSTGTAWLEPDSVFGKVQRADKVLLYALSKDHRLAAIFSVTPENLGQPAKVALSAACRVEAAITSRELVGLGRSIERTFLRVSSGRNEVLNLMSVRGQFEFWLPAGAYSFQASGRGSGGASVEAERGVLEIAQGCASQTLGPLDLHAGKLAHLLDKPAPEFAGITAWRNGPPVSLADLRGKVVILDFWNWACTICCAEMPELFAMHEEYASKGLVIIGMHGLLPTTAEDLDRKVTRLKAGPWKGRAPPFRLALDPPSKSGTTAAYGITAVPAIVLIDRTGKLVAEFGNLRDPEFRKTVQKLIGVSDRL